MTLCMLGRPLPQKIDDFLEKSKGGGVIPDLKKIIANLLQIQTEIFGHELLGENAISYCHYGMNLRQINKAPEVTMHFVS